LPYTVFRQRALRDGNPRVVVVSDLDEIALYDTGQSQCSGSEKFAAPAPAVAAVILAGQHDLGAIAGRGRIGIVLPHAFDEIARAFEAYAGLVGIADLTEDIQAVTIAAPLSDRSLVRHAFL